ncbi:hypothetical protein [Persicirhabdus sediminis]|uniref:Uncharacterized protein n=1 Tax=Persicirhabdus sediminis TaxID=454144 RepID=A0A8J7SM72_9BACT|nr:hypothetical protein [Persicirhabdus sediminis]MBK1791875.1 hypothetical protein [Persicirhabdus sediminis]
MSPIKLLIVPLLILAQLGFALAAPPAQKLNFKCVTVTGSIEAIANSDLKKSVVIKASCHNRSENYALRATQKIDFYALGTDLKSADARPIASVKIPQKSSQLLFVFVPIKQTKDSDPSFRVITLDDSTNKFPNGTVQFINLTSDKLFLIVGQEGKTKKITANPTQPVAYKMAPDFKGNLPIKAAVKNKKQLELIFNSRLFPNKKCRELCFIWPRQDVKRGNKLRTTALRDKAMPQDMQASPKQKPASR